MGSGDLSSSSHSCAARTFPIEMSSLPLTKVFEKLPFKSLGCMHKALYLVPVRTWCTLAAVGFAVCSHYGSDKNMIQ